MRRPCAMLSTWVRRARSFPFPFPIRYRIPTRSSLKISHRRSPIRVTRPHPPLPYILHTSSDPLLCTGRHTKADKPLAPRLSSRKGAVPDRSRSAPQYVVRAKRWRERMIAPGWLSTRKARPCSEGWAGLHPSPSSIYTPTYGTTSCHLLRCRTTWAYRTSIELGPTPYHSASSIRHPHAALLP